MPGPYIPQNPYGSYFNFDDVQAKSAMAFMPFESQGLSPGTQAMMGRPAGGINPTFGEFTSRWIQNQQFSRYMSDVYRGDPRTAAFANLALQAMYGNDNKRRDATVARLGGMGNMQEVIGFIMNQPGISGYLGGSSGSLGIGAYSIAASGMGVNGMTMRGDGPLQQDMARSLLRKVQDKFYTSSGASITGMTQGLNRDQLGGVMALMGAQGAFQGINLGQLVAKGNDAAKFIPDPASMSRITDTIKHGVKALASIMDVYGNADIASLFSKAQQITGLNFSTPENAQLMATRLSRLRTVGNETGIDVMTMFDAAKMGMTMSQSMGLTGHMAAYAGTYSAEQAAIASRTMTYGRDRSKGGFFPSMQEIQAGQVRDIAGMAMDPIGLRRGLVEMILSKEGLPNAAAQTEVESMLDKAGLGGLSEHQMDATMRKYGYNLPQLIRQMGGPEGVQRNMTGANAENTAHRNAKDLDKRVLFRIANRLTRPNFGRASDSALLLVEKLQEDTIQSLLDAAAKPDKGAELMKLLEKNTITNEDPNRYAKAVRDVLEAGGNNVSAVKTNFQLMDQAMRTDELMRRHQSQEAKKNEARAQQAARSIFTDTERGQMTKGLVEGVLSRYGETDSRSAFARVAAYYPDAVIGGIKGLNLPKEGDIFDPQRMKLLVTDLQNEFSKTAEGRKWLMETQLMDASGKRTSPNDINLADLYKTLTDPLLRQTAFRNFKEFGIRDPSSLEARTTFIDKNIHDKLVEHGSLFTIARLAAKQYAESGDQTSADFLAAAVNAVSHPELQLEKIQNGKAVGLLRKLDKSEVEGVLANVRSKSSNINVIGSLIKSLGAEGFADLAKNNREWGRDAAGVLAVREMQVEQDIRDDDHWYSRQAQSGHLRELDLIKKGREALSRVGIESGDGDNTSVMRIVGSLKLVDGALNFEHATARTDKK